MSAVNTLTTFNLLNAYVCYVFLRVFLVVIQCVFLCVSLRLRIFTLLLGACGPMPGGLVSGIWY